MSERDLLQHNCTECQPASQGLCVTFMRALGQPLCDLNPRKLTIIPDEPNQPGELPDSGIIVFIEPN